MVFHIEFDFFDASLRPGVIFGCLPRIVEQLDLAEIFYCQTTPVIRRTHGLETAFAVPSVLVAQHLEPSMSVPTQ